jgi:hypothetical protein
MSDQPAPATVEIRSEQRGPHWVAWISAAEGKPLDSVVLVAASREEAEARARNWAQRLGQVVR